LISSPKKTDIGSIAITGFAVEYNKSINETIMLKITAIIEIKLAVKHGTIANLN
jgi:hypothetical protein